MNAPDESPWSKRRLWWVMASVFAAQIGVLFLFGERTSTAAIEQNPPLHFHFLTEEMNEKEVFSSLLANDPTLFVLPSEADFSGEAWLNRKGADYAPPIWDEPPSLLPLQVDSLGGAFIDYVRSNESAGVEVAAQVFPKSDLAISPTKMEKPSSFRVEGDLAKRALAFRPRLPAMTHSEPVADTVVQVAVNGAGDVVATRLLSPRTGEPGSLAAASEKALEISRTLRFRPVTGGETPTPEWGKIYFRWRTLPVVKTNAVNDFQ